MVVDFDVRRAPGCTVASIRKIGLYREDHLRGEFGELVVWARRRGIRTGKWFFYEHDGPASRWPADRRRWEACLGIHGPANPLGADPDQAAPGTDRRQRRLQSPAGLAADRVPCPW